MKTQISLVTRAEALSLLYADGQTTPTPERVELTRWLMQICREMVKAFARWNDPLLPEMDSLDLVELLMFIEEKMDTEIDAKTIQAAELKTLGDLVVFLEPHLFSNPTFRRMVGDGLKMTRAACPTQSAFYAVRRRLCEAGGSYYAVHALRPSDSLSHLSSKQAWTFVDGLGTDYRIIVSSYWSREDAKMIRTAIFGLTTLFGIFFLPRVTGSVWPGVLVWFFLNTVFALLVRLYTRPEWPRELRTLGDVARKISTTATTLPQADS